MAEAKIGAEYNEDSIRSLDWKEHIRLRPGMYIGKLGDGTAPDDGIYVLIKEVIDNCIDEHTMGYGRHVDVTLTQKTVTICRLERNGATRCLKILDFHLQGHPYIMIEPGNNCSEESLWFSGNRIVKNWIPRKTY